MKTTNMKTKLTIAALFAITAVFFLSCDNPIGLGDKLDLDGPVVNFTEPSPRAARKAQFTIEGSATDISGVNKFILKAELNTQPFAKQWRYERGIWEISENYGASWTAFSGATLESGFQNARWTGTNDVTWSIPIDMTTNGQPLPWEKQGEYLFSIQAWDSGNMTDDNSFKTIVIIVDVDPPSVSIIDPYPHGSRLDLDQNAIPPDFRADTKIKVLHDIADDSPESRDRAYLGQFLTRGFDMKWQIEDNNDIWSIEILFYDYDTVIDEYPTTPIVDEPYFRYSKNLGPPPATPQPEDYLKPNGTVTVPTLTAITEKKTLRVVGVCYDAAGTPNEEKTLGYFVYWPKADEPWIEYTEGMYDPDDPTLDYYYGKDITGTEFDGISTIYPGKSIKAATAFQAHGVSEVRYTLQKCIEEKESNYTILNGLEAPVSYKTVNPPRVINGKEILSTSFTWEITPPPRPGYYIVTATPYGPEGGRTDDELAIRAGDETFSAIFRVQDISFPDFPTSPEPPASDPLYMNINTTANTITITGQVSDGSKIDSLLLVWLNPDSRNSAAMAQLQYFRDPSYAGWKQAALLTKVAGGAVGGSEEEDKNRILTSSLYNTTDPTATNYVNVTQYPYDATAPNKLWKILDGTETGTDDPDYGQIYNYSKTISLPTDLNIGTGAGQRPLKSQMFLLRAENPSGKATIITYAPQGDEFSPEIAITQVDISGSTKSPFFPNTYNVIEKFTQGQTITVLGTWKEDSVAYLPIGTNFTNNFNVTISGYPTVLNLSQVATTDDNGTWTATFSITTSDLADSLRDTLVVNVEGRDIGGNRSEAGASWLIESEHLQLMRISSENTDATYNTGEIKIFLEFNKAVQLTYGSTTPTLTLNTGAIATYINNNSQSTRHYFSYMITSGQNVARLDVTGILASTPAWNTSTYPFTWHRGSGDTREDIKVTPPTETTHTGQLLNGYRVRRLPTTANAGDSQYTLGSGKNITIDTAPPQISTITTTTQPGDYTTAGVISVTVKFSEPVQITGTPQLVLEVYNGTNNSRTTDGSVSGNGTDALTFTYTVKESDTTRGVEVLVANYTGGTITDLANNPLAANAISSRTPANRTLEYIYIDALAPAAPTVRILTANNVNNVLQNTVNGTARDAVSGTTAVTLGNVYNANLWFAIQGNQNSVGGTSTGAHKVSQLEYSINNGASWVKAGNIVNTPWQIADQPGAYQLVARQTDRAGNVSAVTQPINFTWDKGSLITRISSSAANGTYTHTSGRNQIPITVYFRKAVNVTAVTTGITLNALRGGNAITVNTVDGGSSQNNVTSLTFNYTVQNGDSMPAGTNVWLNVTNIQGITATDTGVTGTANSNVNVSSYFTMPTTGNDLLLNENKEIRVETGSLTRSSIAFNEDNTWGSTNEANANYQGIRSDDGSYWTTLDITFNHNIYKGTGNITIEQIQGTAAASYYRLPTVLTEAQYNRFKADTNLNSSIDTYYTKGTNGYINANSRSDTSAKYVLNYLNNPLRGASNTFTGDALVPTTFSDNFRAAERITISVTSQAVEINGATLKVRLTGSNAPQVPGATYQITYPDTLVTDSLGNATPAATTGVAHQVALGGVAKPFVRIRKTQDYITNNTNPSGTVPRLTAAQPRYAYVRMDSRTPNATIQYTRTESTYTATDNNWSTTTGPNYTNTTVVNPGRPGDPAINFATADNNLQIPAAGDTGIKGYKWWVRAWARIGAGTTQSPYVYSKETEEMAYRTAITYRLRSNATNGADMVDPINSGQGSEVTSGQQRVGNGDQIWIRGGDAIGSSTIPGFPFTWADDFTSLRTSQKRAGIRLMTLRTGTGANTTPTVTGTASLNNSTWEFMTWDMNAIAYVDFILGRDANVTLGGNNNGITYDQSTNPEAWQYGPRLWAYHRGGWTGQNTQYPIYPGEHRWLDIGLQTGGIPINFSSVFSSRPDLTDNVMPGANPNQ
jgi:hypothetical protein